MFNKFINGTLNAKMYSILFKMLLVICNAASLFVYGFLHFIFYDFPFEIDNEVLILVKLFSVASAFAAVVCLILIAADAIDIFFKRKQQVAIPAYVKPLSLTIIALIIVLSACNTPIISKGIKKDFNTGITSTYTNMEPGKIMLVMNDEVLNHTDIPLGESFLLVNDNIKGMKVKDGKVSVGCSLSITDDKGNALLQEKDLFAGNDLFNEKDARMLKCTVNTGAPMKWEEKYNVAVTFWDKYGEGKIENKFAIRCIDIP
jgi:hypothetical protein